MTHPKPSPLAPERATNSGPAAASAAVPAAAPSTITWPSAARRAAFEAWLAPLAAAHGLVAQSLRPASADASFRRYLRIDLAAGGSCIVMDAPPELEDCRPFVRVQALMAAAGLRVPQILAWDEAGGFMLLSDLGAHTLIEALGACRTLGVESENAPRRGQFLPDSPPHSGTMGQEDGKKWAAAAHSQPTIPKSDRLLAPAAPAAAQTWYLQAVDALIEWQKASRPGVLPPYDEALLRRELALFPDWYVARHRGIELDDAQQNTLARAFDAIVAHNLAAPSVFVHRDFMPRNLMLPTQVDMPLGVLDFQDAVYGPITYDIASLLRDAFISWDEEFVIDITVRYWEKARRAGLLGAASASGWGADFGEFYRSVEWMGLQRHLKVAGIFARLTLRDGKPKYLADAPRFIAYIRATASRYRELAPLLHLIDQIEGVQEQSGWAFGRVS